MRVPTHLETPENEVTSVPGVSKRQKTRSSRFQAFPNARKRDHLGSGCSQTPENEITSVPGVSKRQKTRSPRLQVFPNARKRDHLGSGCSQTPRRRDHLGSRRFQTPGTWSAGGRDRGGSAGDRTRGRPGCPIPGGATGPRRPSRRRGLRSRERARHALRRRGIRPSCSRTSRSGGGGRRLASLITELFSENGSLASRRGSARPSRLRDPTGHLALFRGEIAKALRRRGRRAAPCRWREEGLCGRA